MKRTVDDPDHDGPASRERTLRRMIERAGRLLPAQGPVSVFVHHNTLHAFEHLPFEEAVTAAASRSGFEPWLPEERYREEMQKLRILEDDLEAVVRDDLGASGFEKPGRRTTRAGIRLTMLKHAIDEGRAGALAWTLAETGALTRFRPDTPQEARRRLLYWARTHGRRTGRGAERYALGALWAACLENVVDAPPEPRTFGPGTRLRDHLLAVAAEDSDLLVHPILIRFSSAFLDQGMAFRSPPDREAGFYACFAGLYRMRTRMAPAWLAGLADELEREAGLGQTATESVTRSLDELGVEAAEREAFIADTLLALRGWAGMIHQFETRPDRVPAKVLPATLLDYLAVRLHLERRAIGWIARRRLGWRRPLAELGAHLRERTPTRSGRSAEERAWLLFQVSQVLGRTPDDVRRSTRDAIARVVEEIESFPEPERRRIFHLAYERRYRMELLDAIATVAAEPEEPRGAPVFQAIFCIDEREESIRRHLEEVEPDCETFGAAGFFGVAMYYRGAADARPVQLCPITIRPRHEIREEIEEAFRREDRRRTRTRRFLGRIAHEARVGSRTLARGTLLTALLGALSALPFVFRVLLPRLTGRLRRSSGAWLVPAATRLTLERDSAAGPEAAGGPLPGFTVDEMSDIVRRLLEDTGLIGRVAPLVLIVGHGSSSLNNPHESAHDCGACGGGRGGPNARIFALMANHVGVRRRLAEQGVAISPDTLFVGAYHDTCDDSVVLYDTGLIDQTRRGDIERLTRALDRARALNAHERCRRFESAPPWLTPALALAHVEGRANDLAQVRPEYGHATNAACLVGRRSRTRGLFLDRRAFLVSYDPEGDDAEGAILARLLASVVPVCAGINLEYWFCHVDPTGYGCGTKLPHNITSLVGVMDGSESDLRTGLPWQMVEIHEPVRLLLVVEARPELVESIVRRDEAIERLVRNRWVTLAALDPAGASIAVLGPGGFAPCDATEVDLPVVATSAEWYGGEADHLAPARVVAARPPTEVRV